MKSTRLIPGLLAGAVLAAAGTAGAEDGPHMREARPMASTASGSQAAQPRAIDHRPRVVKPTDLHGGTRPQAMLQRAPQNRPAMQQGGAGIFKPMNPTTDNKAAVTLQRAPTTRPRLHGPGIPSFNPNLDIVPVKPVLVVMHAERGIAAIKSAQARNNGPATLQHDFPRSVSCELFIGQVAQGGCLYTDYDQVYSYWNPTPSITASGFFPGLPMAPGAAFEILPQLASSPWYVNCRHDAGGHCRITVEVDSGNQIGETNEANNVLTFTW